jgi:hypothetical protein
MALGSTQPLVKMSTRNIPGGKGGRCVRLTTSPPSRAECNEIWEPKPPGTLWATPGLLRDDFTLTFFYLAELFGITVLRYHFALVLGGSHIEQKLLKVLNFTHILISRIVSRWNVETVNVPRTV